MKFKHVSLSTLNMVRLRNRSKYKESRLPINNPLPHSSGATNFPLVFNQHQFDTTLQNPIKEDDEIYLHLLQAVSSSSSEWNILDPISPGTVNRLDKSLCAAAPLHYACMHGNLPMVHFLLENGANVNIWDGGETVTPLICAAAHGHLEIVKVLLEHNCNIDAGLSINRTGQSTALHWAVRGNHSLVVRLLLENKASQNSPVPFSETPVHAAVMVGSPEILRMLIASQIKATKADFQMDSERNTPLHLAASGGHKSSFELCKVLLENGNAYVNSVNAKKQTPLHRAVASKNEKIVKLLLFHHARLNSADEDGKTPLFYAINEDKEALACMKTLINSGNCDVNYQDNYGNTPLHWAGRHNAVGAIEFLLKCGADFSIKAAGGVSALSILRKNIPSTSTLLRKTFDQAVTITSNQIGDGKTGNNEQECEIEVDFKYVLPSTPNNTQFLAFQEKVRKNPPSCYARVASLLKLMLHFNPSVSRRKETSKIKCLLKEEYRNLLLHPVIHSFLELKWHNARFFFLPTLFFKIFLVLLFTTFLKYPYIPMDGERDTSLLLEQHLNSSLLLTYCGNNASSARNSTGANEEEKLTILKTWYILIVTMAILNALMELSEIVRAPAQQLKALHPWISVVVWYMIYDSQPESWEKASDPCRRSMAALKILLAWIGTSFILD